ncbi:MAG TPA: hypothetical protein VGC57_09230 [Cellulomonas sp.]
MTADGAPTGRTTKGGRRRDQLARAAADLVREEGPAALSHRAVAQRARVPLSATTYYFSGLDDLAAAAGAGMVDAWVTHAEQVLARVRGGSEGDPAAVLVQAVLPPGDEVAVRAHYEQLLAAGRVPALAAALAAGRSRLDGVLTALLAEVAPSLTVAAPLVLAVVDGAVVTAVSEGRAIRPTAQDLVGTLLAP